MSLMYFKWDLFCRHIKKWVNVAKMGLSGYFFVMEKTHKYTNVRMSIRLSELTNWYLGG